MKILKVLILYLSIATILSATEVYFSPSPDCENRIVKAIQESKNEIAVAVYSFNNRKITSALQDAKKRGIKIRVLTDYLQAMQRNSQVLPMLESGLDLRVHTHFKIEHNKFAVYDGKLLSTGSFNWTGAASRSNSENCLFLEDPAVITKYKERFEFLWQKNTEDGSKARISKIKAKQRTVSSNRK